ncbi:hypothetical protein [Methylocucumis oryzae]|uniref:Uncharacterized protein n=1 Tax=Methylocucumis oryzae TaxID=1632867 RepID=A0A0F3IKD8_9GAMM|nr:hypothetical protein [Methylocucumis oryzae]KJV07166.1 hypothetical protein VZ94_06585 [Methylocucumis oryzae]
MKNSTINRLVNLERARVQTLQNYPPLTDEQLQAVIDDTLTFDELSERDYNLIIGTKTLDELTDNQLLALIYGRLN